MIVTLLTDFGLEDEFVGVMKGVLLAQEPGLRIVDISHAVPPQDIPTASLLLAASWPFFPPGAVHAVVVDPTVGSNRKIVALFSGGHYFIGPDNGVFSPLLAADNNLVAREVANAALFLPRVSATFHGRDIIAPVAARLAAGMALAVVGPALSAAALVRLPTCSVMVEREAGRISGRIVRVDHFGNLASDITAADLAAIGGKGAELVVEIGGRRINGVGSTYAGATTGGLLALIDSRGRVEIAAQNASAAKLLTLGRGAMLVVSRR